MTSTEHKTSEQNDGEALVSENSRLTWFQRNGNFVTIPIIVCLVLILLLTNVGVPMSWTLIFLGQAVLVMALFALLRWMASAEVRFKLWCQEAGEELELLRRQMREARNQSVALEHQLGHQLSGMGKEMKALVWIVKRLAKEADSDLDSETASNCAT